MIYIFEDNILNEYQVLKDEKKLKQIKEKIIYNCSYIEHCSGVFAHTMSYSDSKIVKLLNLEQIKLAYIQENMGWPDTNYYEYTYDKYYFPNIVNIIDEILIGDDKKIPLLFEEESKKISIDEDRNSDINILKRSISLINEYILSLDEKILEDAIYTLNSYKHRNFEKPKSKVEDFYSDLQECFEFNLVDKKSNDKLNKIKELFGEDWKVEVNQLLDNEEHIKESKENEFVKKFIK